MSRINTPSEDPDFFLSTEGEMADSRHPRACWQRQRLRDNIRDDYMLVEIEPPVIGQGYGLGDKDITQLILATRHHGFTLFPLTESPAHVYVFRILDEELLRQEVFEARQVEMISWGIVSPSLSDLSV